VLPFHTSLLEPAVAAQAAVQPVAIRYTRADASPCTQVSYDAGATLWDCVQRMAAEPFIHADLMLLPPLGAHSHRRALAHDARNAIVAALATPAPRTRSERSGDLRVGAR
jgi:1-acyl-sn-glycerol-3-phosphate acyltransferase